MLFTDTMTVFNQIEEGVWKRSIIKGVQWAHNKLETITSGTTQSQQRVESITVDCGRDYGNPKYVDPITYANLANKDGYYTFDTRNGQDMCVLGVCDEDLTPKEIKQRFQYFGIVERVSDNRNRDYLKNIKVTLR